MGSVLLSNLNLNMGNNTFTATSDFQVSPKLANQFIMTDMLSFSAQRQSTWSSDFEQFCRWDGHGYQHLWL
jgi:hypothetical protein